MGALDSKKSAFLYRQIRRRLQSGEYLPGQRIDPATLAAEFGTSQTPVRFALYRLVGRELIEDHARSGLHVPLPNEVALRELYDWMEHLLLACCDLAAVPAHPPQDEEVPAVTDTVERTWKLFDDIARATNNRCLHENVKRTNDRLAPIRRSKSGLVDGADAELEDLGVHWRCRSIDALKTSLSAYHARRRRMVPEIVALLTERSSALH